MTKIVAGETYQFLRNEAGTVIAERIRRRWRTLQNSETDATRHERGPLAVHFWPSGSFCRVDGSEQPANSGAPPIFAVFGDEAVLRLHRSGIAGGMVTCWHNQAAAPTRPHLGDRNMLTKLQVTSCPQCGQPIAPTGLRLSPIKERIYEAVRRRPGITAQQLRDWVWADDLDGGPLTDTKCLHVHVAQLNTLLRPHGIMVRSQGGGYQSLKAAS